MGVWAETQDKVRRRARERGNDCFCPQERATISMSVQEARSHTRPVEIAACLVDGHVVEGDWTQDYSDA